MAEEILTADVAVIGAGPAGSTTAALLAARGHCVLLLDRATFPRDKTCGDGLTPRAVAVLDRIGLLDGLRSAGYRQIGGARLVAPGGAVWHLRFADYDFGLPPFGLAVPRLELDERLRRHAVAKGACFLGGVQVSRLLRQDGRVAGLAGQRFGHPLTVHARLTILATGANIALLRALGVLSRMPPGIRAIRAYSEDVPGLNDEFEFYFDRELLPGYAWIFPLGDGRANVGLGLFTRGVGSPAPNLRKLLARLVERHPRLREARPTGPAKPYPLRVDFPRCPSLGDGFMLVGEALGLVNPVTGEGIDLALESAELAADAADEALRCGDTGAGGLTPYRKALHARFGSFFRGMRLLLRLAMGPRALDILIRQAARRPHLARTIAGINMGMASSWLAFSPRTWRDILR